MKEPRPPPFETPNVFSLPVKEVIEMTEIISAAASLDDLTAQIKIKLVENHVLTNAFNRNINQNSVAIGQYLTQVKKLVNHGEWQNWLADNFDMTDRTARNYMKVAAYFGGNSILKNENVFVFQPAALIELTKIPTAELQKFLAETPNAEKLSVRNLREKIRNWRVPAPSTVEVDAEIKTACADGSPLKLPPPSFSKVPNVLLDAANKELTQTKNPCKLSSGAKNLYTGFLYMYTFQF